MLDGRPEQGDAEVMARRPDRRPRGAFPSVLLVEDDDDCRELLTELLAENGFVVTGLATGEAATAAVETCEFDVVLADLDLPGGDGWEVGRVAKRRRPWAAVVYMTGCERPTGEAARYGVDAVVTRPMRPLELVQLLRELAAAAREARP